MTRPLYHSCGSELHFVWETYPSTSSGQANSPTGPLPFIRNRSSEAKLRFAITFHWKRTHGCSSRWRSENSGSNLIAHDAKVSSRVILRSKIVSRDTLRLFFSEHSIAYSPLSPEGSDYIIFHKRHAEERRRRVSKHLPLWSVACSL